MDYSVLNYTDADNYTIFDISFNETDDGDTGSSPSGGRCSYGMELFRYIAEVWIAMPIACFGIIGNILAFIVLCNHKQKLTTTIILQCLAFVDTLILLAVIPTRSFWYSYICMGFPANYKEPWKLMFRWVYPMIFVFRMMDTWLITFLTLDRWIAVCKPLHAPRLCTKRSTYLRLVILIISAIILALPRFFESTQYGFFDVGKKTTVLQDFRWYIILYQVVLFFLGMYLIPMILLVVLNIQLILALRRANAGFAGRRHSQSSTSTQRRGITVIVVTVVTTCIICNLLAMVSHLMLSIEKIAEDNEDLVASVEQARRPLSVINNIFIVLNSSINFLLYCFSSKNFRTITYNTLCCLPQCRKIRRTTNRFTSQQSSNTYDTYVPLRQTNGTSNENGVKLQKFINSS